MIGAQEVLGEVVSPRERGRYLGLLSGSTCSPRSAARWRAAWSSIDLAGGVLLAAAVLATVLLASLSGRGRQLPGWLVAALVALAVLAVLARPWTARRAADPIVPLRLLGDRGFAVSAAMSFVIGFALFGAVSFLPAHLQIAPGASSTRAGLVVTCLMAGVIFTMVISGQLISRTGRYRIFPIIGTALAAAGLALLGTVEPATPTPLLLAYLVAIGLGVGLTMQVMMLVAQNGAPQADLGTATSTRFGENLPAGVAARLPEGAAGLSAERLGSLPADLRAAVAAAYGAAVRSTTPRDRVRRHRRCRPGGFVTRTDGERVAPATAFAIWAVQYAGQLRSPRP